MRPRTREKLGEKHNDDCLWFRKSRFMDTKKYSFNFPSIVKAEHKDEIGHLEQLKCLSFWIYRWCNVMLCLSPD